MGDLKEDAKIEREREKESEQRRRETQTAGETGHADNSSEKKINKEKVRVGRNGG